MKPGHIAIIALSLLVVALNVYYYTQEPDEIGGQECTPAPAPAPAPYQSNDDNYGRNIVFSKVEDGLILAELEASNQPSELRDRLAIVYSSMDEEEEEGPPLVSAELASHSKIGFFFFDVNEESQQQIPSPWRHIMTPYYSYDWDVDISAHNSFSRLYPTKSAKVRSMRVKYFKCLAWRVPELQDYRYIMYLEPGFDLSKATSELYQKILHTMKNGVVHSNGNRRDNITGIVPTHLLSDQTITTEAMRAGLIPFFGEDHVWQQAVHYVQDWHCPEYPGQIYSLSMMIYDSYSVAMRRLLHDLYVECQVWSLEDQLSFFYVMWKLNMIENIHTVDDICTEFFNIKDKGPKGCRSIQDPQ